MELLVKIKHVPDGASVTKKTGNAEFIVRNSLTLFTYGPDGSTPDRKVISEEGIKYMMGARGDVTMVSEETVVKINLIDEFGDIKTGLLESVMESITGQVLIIDMEESR